MRDRPQPTPQAWSRCAGVALVLLFHTPACSGVVEREPLRHENDAGYAVEASVVKDASIPDSPIDSGYKEVEAQPETSLEANTDVVGGDSADSSPDSKETAVDILDALKATPGIEAHEGYSKVSGCRYFRLVVTQPSDHHNPTGPNFGQRIGLLHCSPTAPMVLANTGYWLWSENELWELTELFGANQLVVEQRFFGESIADSPTWTDLTIQQAAADHHRIVEALRPLYPGAWLSTGASKGGMTSVYHRRFYPDDVAATVAYVAPSSHAVEDDRYEAFLEQIGPEDCRQRIKNFQRECLKRRPAMLDRMSSLAKANGDTYLWLGLDKAFEHAVTEFWVYLWQYSDDSECPQIPDENASDDQVFAYLNYLSPVASVADLGVASFAPYYYQAATQLGGPKQAYAHLLDLLVYPGTDVPASYAPKGEPLPFDPLAMQDIESWVKNEAERLLFIYGENDPWSAGAYELGSAKESYLFWVPQGNHYASIGALPEPARSQALAALEKWLGAKPKFPDKFATILPELAGRRPKL